MARQFDDLGSIELFCLAAELGGFTAAAQQAGLTPGAVSRAITRLESRLGVRLFVRTTRQMRLTDAGGLYLAQCRQALGQIQEAERLVSGQQAQPSGVLRISMPCTYGQYRIMPLVPSFREKYPKVELVLHMSGRNIAFGDEPFDLAIRARAPADSRLVARKLEDAELVVVASPAYLARAGEPLAPDDLSAHECVQFELPSSGRCVDWLFAVQGRVIEWPTSGGITCRDEIIGGVPLVIHGAGLYQTYRFIVAAALASGELVEVLKPFGGCSRPFTVLYPHDRHQPLRVRAFVDHLLQGVQSR